mmetsp:Transcript_21779/g.47520  ORF Transcript_21779/g.47520 Transcript_21779/m.47520 type:complete len:491 (+) Transcript_21779:64-1536(+)
MPASTEQPDDAPSGSVGNVFILKDSPPDLIDAASVKPQGRKYNKEIAESQPGSIKIEDVVQGMKYASLAITDDKEGTLAKVGKSNPWHIDALKIITGSEEEAHKPLTHILNHHMNLTVDAIIDISGVTPGGHPLDTQGYIAHNDEVIVLAYRSTTSLKDWLTNLNTTSSDWEIEEDLAQGYSGFLSGLEGLCCTGGEYKPRVHTGFYNNFLASAPSIQKHIDPLLKPDQPPRKLYVVGHSLGAGIATLASCYFLLEHDFAALPHKLVSVTAGSPRACQNSMREVIEAKLSALRPLDKAVMCRLVRDADVVPTVPPSFLGFKHIGKLVFISDSGDILINPKLKNVVTEKQIKGLVEENPEIKDEVEEIAETRDESETSMSSTLKSYARIPKPFRDHMPQYYLDPLLVMFEKDYGVPRPEVDDDDATTNTTTKKKKGFFTKFGRKKKAKHGRDDSDTIATTETTKSKRKSKLFKKRAKGEVDPAPISASSKE